MCTLFLFILYVLFEVNYFLRVIFILIIGKLWYREKFSVSEEFVSYGICTFNDLDMFLHMNNARYIREFEFARSLSGMASGVWSAIHQLGGGAVLSAVSVRYRRSIGLFHVFRVRTKVLYYTDRDVYFEQHMETIHDNFVRAVCYGKVTFTGGVTYQDIYRYLTADEPKPSPEPSPDLKCWIEANRISSEKLRKKQ